MDLNKILETYKNRIASNLRELLDKDSIGLKKINNWGKDVIERLKEFSLGGKLLRGSLILFCSDMYSKNEVHGSTEVASAIELIHSSLLIHDDIMDRDKLRRSKPTIHYQYKDIYPNKDRVEAIHFGESMAICSGDIGFFTAFYILSTTPINSTIIKQILRIWSMEFSYVGAAQMDDMHFEVTNEEIPDDKILNMYRYKTSRYTFSLPMVTGAILAGAPEEDIKNLEKLGEKIGIIFQIKDDELGLFGKEEKTGKPAGSDIKEGKNTLYISYLKRMTFDNNRRTVNEIIANRDSSKEAIERLKNILIKSGIKKRIDNLVLGIKEEANKIINTLNIDKMYKELLKELINYIYKREK